MDIGAELRAAREAKGLTLGTLAQRTRVQARTLAAIEVNNLSAIPPRPFGRGFVRAYAQEVNLDPERTVHDYFAQFPAAPQPPPSPRSRSAIDLAMEPPSQWTALGTAAAILLVVVAAAVVVGGRNDASNERASTDRARTDALGVIGATGTSGKNDAATRTSPGAVAAPAATTTSAQPVALRLAFSVSRPCWVAATTDSRRVIYRIVQAGEKITLDGEREIAARFGDASAVSWSFNGRAGAPLGAEGVVKDLHCRLATGDCRF